MKENTKKALETVGLGLLTIMAIAVDATAEANKNYEYSDVIDCLYENNHLDGYDRAKCLDMIEKGKTSDYYHGLCSIIKDEDDGYYVVKNVRRFIERGNQTQN